MMTTAYVSNLALTWAKPVKSAAMSSTKRRWLAIAAVAALGTGTLSSPATALAQPGSETEPPPGTAAEPAPEVLHNVIYRARADGTSRDAVVAYKMDDQNVNSATPTMLPGQTFEVNTVLADPKLAGMEVSIGWPYGSNLHCEILVDNQIVAQADQFIAPRFFRVKDDPLIRHHEVRRPSGHPEGRRSRASRRASRPGRHATGSSSATGDATRGLTPTDASLWCPPIPRPAGRRRETTAPWHRRTRRYRRAPLPPLDA